MPNLVSIDAHPYVSTLLEFYVRLISRKKPGEFILVPPIILSREIRCIQYIHLSSAERKLQLMNIFRSGRCRDILDDTRDTNLLVNVDRPVLTEIADTHRLHLRLILVAIVTLTGTPLIALWNSPRIFGFATRIALILKTAQRNHDAKNPVSH